MRVKRVAPQEEALRGKHDLILLLAAITYYY